MQTLKTALVVVLLLFVIYGAFVAINGSNTELNPEFASMVDLDTNTPDIGGVTGPFVSSSMPPSSLTPSATDDPWAQFQSKPAAGFNAQPVASNAGVTPPSLPTLPAAIESQTASNASSNPAAGTLPTLEASDLPPLPPLPPIVSSGSLPPSSETAPSLPGASDTLSPLPGAFAGSSSPKLPETASVSDVASTDTPDFGLAIPTAPKSQPAANLAAESPSLNAASSLPGSVSLPSTDLLPKLPEANTSSGSTAQSAPVRPSKSYSNAKAVALEQAGKGQLKEALATLSVFYNSADLDEAQRTDLVDLLDALAAEVIYSREHYLDLPYFTAAGETLDGIAKRYQIPVEVLASINGLDQGAVVNNGTKLKVLPGPFRAEVDLNRKELTLFLGELYASRFPVSVGKDPNPQPGSYSVVSKDRNKNYYGSSTPIMATDANNPYGGFWIDLGNQLSIHGSTSGANENLGCISLSPKDVADVFGMLSSGSQVTIRR
ncbi:L,D-transpeptidase family protein [Pirellulaceae bacterium SH449]